MRFFPVCLPFFYPEASGGKEKNRWHYVFFSYHCVYYFRSCFLLLNPSMGILDLVRIPFPDFFLMSFRYHYIYYFFFIDKPRHFSFYGYCRTIINVLRIFYSPYPSRRKRNVQSRLIAGCCEARDSGRQRASINTFPESLTSVVSQRRSFKHCYYAPIGFRAFVARS